MAIKRELQNNIDAILKHNKDGAFETQRNRRSQLFQMADDLVEGGYKLRDAQHLKLKHVQFLIEQWKSETLSAATIKNRLCNLRWLSEKIGKANLIPSNNALHIEKRVYISNKDKSIQLTAEQLNKITNPFIQFSLQLQEQFGLRREEALKFQPFLADRDDHIFLKASWCKGGRERNVPIRTSEQRELLDRIKTFIKKPELSLIPENKTYKAHRSLYNKQLQRAGIYHTHGLRHAYAQKRFLEIAGFQCPVKVGPKRKELTTEQMIKNHEARSIVSLELGHNRLEVTNAYLSR